MERFWAKVKKGSGCWIWTGARTTSGYGFFNLPRNGLPKRVVKAHRYAWTLAQGAIPDGMFVCHSCDVPLCCNPEHLWLGTHDENMRDMVRKGRTRGGRIPVYARFHKKSGKWHARRPTLDGVEYIGSFDSREEAIVISRLSRGIQD